LFDIQTRPELTCQFSWQPGSIALWDNRCAQLVNDYHGHRRVMRESRQEMFGPAVCFCSGGRALLSAHGCAGRGVFHAVH
jgi:hypothetical protein